MIYDNSILACLRVGITKLISGTDQYNAATDLIGAGVTFDSCSAGPAKTILKLSDLKKNQYNRYKKCSWASSARLDNQGDINSGEERYYMYIKDVTVEGSLA